jgi:hypothetical protein
MTVPPFFRRSSEDLADPRGAGMLAERSPFCAPFNAGNSFLPGNGARFPGRPTIPVRLVFVAPFGSKPVREGFCEKVPFQNVSYLLWCFPCLESSAAPRPCHFSDDPIEGSP